MPMRPPAGFISANYDPLRNPDAPTGVTASAGDAQASVSFTTPANVGGSAISAYYAVSNPGQITASGASSPVTVTGLANGTAYTFQVWALNTFGPGAFSAASGSVTPVFQRGIFTGMQNLSSVSSNVIQYISIASTGNASDFGDLISIAEKGAGGSSSTRGLVAGGGGQQNVIQYVTIASLGNAVDFGDLSAGRSDLGACSNDTRCVFGGGRQVGQNPTNIIEYVTIATTGNTTNFGQLTVARYSRGGVQSTTRGVFCGGNAENVMDYITIATTGNATDFGDVTFPTSDAAYLSGCSSNTRGLLSTNNGAENIIGYITIASTGNTSDFGDLTVGRRIGQATSSKTRGVFAGGTLSGGVTVSNVIDYVTIATIGNATDFGDLIDGDFTFWGCGFSSNHGGLS